jgi:AP-2 complex subunit alpha
LPVLHQWVNLFPEIKDQLVAIFERYRHVLDAELQQRACEYLAIATRNDDNELLEIVCEEMPPFPERESALLTRLHGKSDGNHDKRTWVIGGKSDNQERQASRYRSFTQGSASGAPAAALAYVNSNGHGNNVTTTEQTEEPEQIENLMGPDDDVAVSTDIMSTLAGLNIGDASTAQQTPLLHPGVSPQESPAMETDAGAIPTAEPISTSAALAAMSLTKGHGIEKVSDHSGLVIWYGN